MPASPPLAATQHYTLADIDAAIATFVDPLTPDEVVALAQWWTLRHLRHDVGIYTGVEELRLLSRAGRGAEAVQTVLECFATDEELVVRLSIIYEAMLHKDARLLQQIYQLVGTYTETAQLAGKPPPEHILRMLTELEARCGHYEAALHLARSNSQSVFEATVRQIITHLMESGCYEALDYYCWLLPTTHDIISLHHLHHLKTVISEAIQMQADALAEHYLAHLRRYFNAIEQAFRSEIDVEWDAEVLPQSHQQTYMRAAEIYSHCLILTGHLIEARACLSQLPANVDPAQLLSAIQIARKRPLPVYDVVSFWDGLPDGLKQGLMAVVMIEWLIEVGAADSARQALQALPKDAALYPLLLPAYHQLGNDDMVRQFTFSYAEQAAQHADKHTGQWIAALIASEQLGEAARLAALVPHVSRFHFYSEIAAAALLTQPGLMVSMQVRRWLADPAPVTIPAMQWEWGCFTLVYNYAQSLAALDRDMAFVWALEASCRLQNLHEHSQYSTWIPGHLYFLLEIGDEPSARYWADKLAELPVVLRVYARGGQYLLKQGKVSAAAAWIDCLFAARTRLLNQKLRPMLHVCRAILAASAGQNHPPHLPAEQRQRLDRHKLTQKTKIAKAWHDKQVTTDVFLGALTLSSRILNALAPDLYTRTLQACIDVIANFAPAWADLLTETEGIPA